MDKSKFELTMEERDTIGKRCGFRPYECYLSPYLQAQVAKVLAMLEPVQLEALGDKEIRIVFLNSPETLNDGFDFAKLGSQATIRKNQAKGQLYRVKE